MAKSTTSNCSRPKCAMGPFRPFDEVTKSLFPENRKSSCDSVKRSFQVHVNHVVPIIHPQIIKRRDRTNARVLFKVLRLGSAMPARYSSIFLGARRLSPRTCELWASLVSWGQHYST
jgi:hypothetical protein